MKTYILAAAATLLMSGAALAGDPPIMLGNFSASVKEAASEHTDQTMRSSNVDRMPTASIGQMRMDGNASMQSSNWDETAARTRSWEYPGAR
ncbi:hypothetical protein [Aliihoeflea sp. PC F10.4]